MANPTWKRIWRAVGAETLGQILNFAIRLLLVPLFISIWGLENYGYWLTLTSLSSWISLTDLGGQLYYQNSMNIAWTQKRFNDFQSILTSGLVFFFSIAVSFTVLFGILLFSLPFGHWFHYEALGGNIGNLIILIVAVKIVLSLPYGIILGIFRIVEKQATSVMYVNLTLLIQLLLSVTALMLKGSMFVLAAIEIIPLIIVMFISGFHIKRLMPESFKFLSAKHFSLDIIKTSIKPSLHFFIIQVSTSLIIQGCTLITARVLGPAEVVVFNSLRTVANMFSQFIGVLSHSAWPELTRLHAQKENRKLFDIYAHIANLLFIAGLTYFCFLNHWGEYLFNIWMRGKVEYFPMTMFLISLLVVLNSVWTFGSYMLMATNQHTAFSKKQLVVNFVALILFAIGVKFYGLNAGIAGLIIGQSIPMTLVIYNNLKKYNWFHMAHYLLILQSVGLTLYLTTLIPFVAFTILAVEILAFLYILKVRKYPRAYENLLNRIYDKTS